MSQPPRAQLVDTGDSGSWQITALPYGDDPVNLTVFRGAATGVDGVSSTDPFGPAAATLTFPAVTMLEQVGVGDLAPLQPETDVDIAWVTPEGEVLYVWEGYFLSYGWGEDAAGGQLTITCMGAMRQLDNDQAKPAFLFRPLPYETALRRMFRDRPYIRCQSMITEWPLWWDKTYDSSKYDQDEPWSIPEGVQNGALWSSMLTRTTGNWEPALTGYAQGLLSNMHTSRGQFTLLLDAGRQPVLRHRTHRSVPVDNTLMVDVLAPGVKMAPEVDYSQRANVIYAKGQASNGDTYTGMEVTADGSETYYLPAAARRQVEPIGENFNPWYQAKVMRRELILDFPEGIDYEDAKVASRDHLQRFSHPGITGTLTLQSDPTLYLSDERFPRQAIDAGRHIVVKGLFGRPEGVMFHITEVSYDGSGDVTLTVDSLFRDHLTVDQIRKRGRDSLKPYRMLSTMGTYDPGIPDLLFPWSYKRGAGMIPYRSVDLFLERGPTKLGKYGPDTVANPFAVPFPWTEYTTLFPPKDYPQFYIKMPAASHQNANLNWANRRYQASRTNQENLDKFQAFPVMLSAVGEIKLVQIAAYDRLGNVKKVPFHASLYLESGVSYTTMPMIPESGTTLITKLATIIAKNGDKTIRLDDLPKNHGMRVGDSIEVSANGGWNLVDGNSWRVNNVGAQWVEYNALDPAPANREETGKVWSRDVRGVDWSFEVGQHYPFFPNAFENIRRDGTTPTNQQQLSAKATMLAGWGNFYEQAGYWPGSSSEGDRKTGMLVDESGFSYDFRNRRAGIDVYKPADEQNNKVNVQAWLMIYCDEDVDQNTFFLGRMFRKELTGA